jgi:hypothetical protein
MSNAKVAIEQIHATVRLRPVRDSRRLRQTGQVATERAVNKGNCCKVPQSEQAIVIATRAANARATPQGAHCALFAIVA